MILMSISLWLTIDVHLEVTIFEGHFVFNGVNKNIRLHLKGMSQECKEIFLKAVDVVFKAVITCKHEIQVKTFHLK